MQGLANLLWSYSKMELPPLDVMLAIVRQMTVLLCQPLSAASFDAQALSNSVWALAHIRCSATELDMVAGHVGCVQVGRGQDRGVLLRPHPPAVVRCGPQVAFDSAAQSVLAGCASRLFGSRG